jgi:hypothetical protein
MKYLLLMILCIPIAFAMPSYTLPGDYKMENIEGVPQYMNETIIDASFIQFYDIPSSLILDISLMKFNSYFNATSNSTYFVQEEFLAEDNLTVNVSAGEQNLKWGYSLILNGDKPQSCSKNKECSDKQKCVNNFCIDKKKKHEYKHVKVYDSDTAFKMIINSTKPIEKSGNHTFKISDFFFDYSDLLNEGYNVTEQSTGSYIILDITKEWSKFNITDNSFIVIDPYFGEQTPDSPPVTKGGVWRLSGSSSAFRHTYAS